MTVTTHLSRLKCFADLLEAPIEEYLLIAAISLVAYFLNGITGFGSNLVFIPLAALVIGPKEAVVLCSVLYPFAGGALLQVDTKKVPRTYWWPLCAATILGNIVGAFALKSIPNELFGFTMGLLVLFLGAWFLSGRRGGSFAGLTERFPETSSWQDSLVCALAGFCGASFGFSGPLLVWHFGRVFAKEAFRKVLVLMYFPASFFRIGAYLLLGLVSKELCLFAVLSLPFLFAGTYAGNHVFKRISLPRFNLLIGGTLVATALKLFFSV